MNVVPKIRGSSGAQLLKLEIVSQNERNISKVASEGEQRGISIACFLAEMKMDNRKSAIIFDDPVNSLSHRWSYKVAKRLAEESLYRQVIIFTHSLAFYKRILEEVEMIDSSDPQQLYLDVESRMFN